MSGIFNLDAPIWVFMGEVADVIILSLLWWVCCLGIITIGASTTAMYYVLGKKMRKETTYVAKDFFKSFGQNFRQSVPLSIMMSIGFVSFFIYVTLTIQGILVPSNASSLKFLIPITILFAFELFNFNAYLWGLLSRFDMKNRGLIKTAFIMVHRHLLTTFANVAVVALVCMFIYKCPLLIIVAPGLIIGGQSFLIQNIFTHYIEAAKEEVAKEENTKETEIVESVVDETAEAEEVPHMN